MASVQPVFAATARQQKRKAKPLSRALYPAREPLAAATETNSGNGFLPPHNGLN
jgi:hypothetical protein